MQRKRPVVTEDGFETGMEEYIDYLFPDEAGVQPNLKLLEMAQKWKRQKMAEEGSQDQQAVS